MCSFYTTLLTNKNIMGSSSNRKTSDKPIIQRPLKSSGGTGGSGAGGGRGLPERVAQTCPPSFEIEIKESSLTKEGEVVSLSKNKDGEYEVTLSGQIVATLDKKESDMVDVCGEMGISYRGKVVKRKKEFYAQFLRTP
jgi:hypothetical protein